MTLTKTELAKMIAGKVATAGAAIITYSVINNNLPDNNPLHKKVATVVASYVIVDMLNTAVRAQSDKIVDQIVNGYTELKTKIQK